MDADDLIFFANWQCQAGAAVHRATQDAGERRRLAAYLHDLQGQIIEARRFYREVEQVRQHRGGLPENCATVDALPAHCPVMACL